MAKVNLNINQKNLIEKIRFPTLTEILILSNDQLDSTLEVLDMGSLATFFHHFDNEFWLERFD